MNFPDKKITAQEQRLTNAEHYAIEASVLTKAARAFARATLANQDDYWSKWSRLTAAASSYVEARGRYLSLTRTKKPT